MLKDLSVSSKILIVKKYRVCNPYKLSHKENTFKLESPLNLFPIIVGKAKFSVFWGRSLKPFKSIPVLKLNP